MYGQAGLGFRRAFLALMARDYAAGLRTADFARDAAAARAEINAWVSAQTQGKIPQLMGPGDVDQTTRLVLVNAVYLDAKWLQPFAHGDTFPAPFHAPAGTVKVPTMHQTGVFGYVQGAGVSGARIALPGRAPRVRHPAPEPRRIRIAALAPRPARDRCRCSPGCGGRRSRSRCRSSG